jgi:hypothetical protein
MGRYEKILNLAQEKKMSIRDLLVNHVLKDIETRQKIVDKMNIEDDEEYESNDVYQLCDTPRSQQKLISYF